MTIKELEDVPEEDLARAFDYIGALAFLAPSRTAQRVAAEISTECLIAGESRISHRELERRSGVRRRTMQKAIRRLVADRFIARTGTTDAGVPVYATLWERGAEWRASRKDLAHDR